MAIDGELAETVADFVLGGLYHRWWLHEIKKDAFSLKELHQRHIIKLFANKGPSKVTVFSVVERMWRVGEEPTDALNCGDFGESPGPQGRSWRRSFRDFRKLNDAGSSIAGESTTENDAGKTIEGRRDDRRRKWLDLQLTTRPWAKWNSRSCEVRGLTLLSMVWEIDAELISPNRIG